MSNNVYDVLKKFCLVVIPAFNTLLIALNALWSWNLPIEAITGSTSAVALFIGAVLGFSSAQYAKGASGDRADG